MNRRLDGMMEIGRALYSGPSTTTPPPLSSIRTQKARINLDSPTQRALGRAHPAQRDAPQQLRDVRGRSLRLGGAAPAPAPRGLLSDLQRPLRRRRRPTSMSRLLLVPARARSLPGGSDMHRLRNRGRVSRPSRRSGVERFRRGRRSGQGGRVVGAVRICTDRRFQVRRGSAADGAIEGSVRGGVGERVLVDRVEGGGDKEEAH